nr:MAG TPA: hypothetical protein [Bacteriophage sp.]
MCDNKRNNNNNNQRNDNQQRPAHEHGEYRDYGHIDERVEETDSTKNPPEER